MYILLTRRSFNAESEIEKNHISKEISFNVLNIPNPFRLIGTRSARKTTIVLQVAPRMGEHTSNIYGEICEVSECPLRQIPSRTTTSAVKW